VRATAYSLIFVRIPLAASIACSTEWEEHVRQEVEADTTIGDTEKTQIVLALRGQEVFTENVRKLEERWSSSRRGTQVYRS